MTSPREAARELEQLLMTLTDGELSYQQQQHLMALLRQQPELQRQYRDYLLLDALLHWESPAVPVLPAPLPTGRMHVTRLPRFHWLAGLAAGLLLILGGYQLRTWEHGTTDAGTAFKLVTDEPGVGEPRLEGLAVLTRSVQARWHPETTTYGLGATIPAGILKLQSGLVQLEFFGGARLLVEGPAELELLTRDRLCCHAGKLRAVVPPQAHGFTILSATAELIDRGTEFGVEVTRAGSTELHVFEGKVEVHDRRRAAQAPNMHEVTAGQGMKMEEAGPQIPIIANKQRFMSQNDIDRRARQVIAARYDQWKKVSEDLRHDPRLLAYYPFERRRGQERTLAAVNDPDGSSHGAIIGCEWVGGRWPERQALEFKRPGDRVRVTLPGEYETLTWMAWVRVDALERQYNALFLTDGFEVGAAHWQITAQGKLRLCICHGMNGAKWLGHTYDSEVVLPPDQLGQWKHLTTVYDNNVGLITHYVNGQRVGQRSLRLPVRLSLGNAEIGNWRGYANSQSPPMRTFNGRMDEFLLFQSALTDEEIEELYYAGQPTG